MELDPTCEELSELKTAISEAVTNAIVHAYPEKMGTVWIKLRILGDEVLEISVKDKGRGIPDVKKAMEPLYTTGGEDRSGMGFTIMDSFMDKIRVRSSPGKGTAVTMQRRIKSKR